jgi:hypothetical protein
VGSPADLHLVASFLRDLRQGAEHLPETGARDPVTGVALASLRWGLLALSLLRRLVPVEDLAHVLNLMASAAEAILRAGGTEEELRAYERDGFTWGPFWKRITTAETRGSQ